MSTGEVSHTWQPCVPLTALLQALSGLGEELPLGLIVIGSGLQDTLQKCFEA
jgi:hypothetical protein